MTLDSFLAFASNDIHDITSQTMLLDVNPFFAVSGERDIDGLEDRQVVI
jgi:hypothetical protein